METIVKNALELAGSGKIDFLTYVEMIADAGVEDYSVDVGSNIITYGGFGETFVEHMPGAFEVADAYNEEELKAALAAIENNNIAYPEFLKRIAAAGIESYEVDIQAKTVTYKGHGQSYAESFPTA